MTDKKFTDEEIIEALDLCTQQNGSIPCYDCPCWNDDEQECKGIDYTAALDLIKRQKAEIENAKAKIKICAEVIERQDTEIEQWKEEANKYQKLWCIAVDDIETAKAEAYKEFAEKLKEEYCDIVLYGKIVTVNTIDNLLKEMVGEEE